MASRRILIMGATGQQGNAVIRALSDLKIPGLRILALTRDKNSGKAKSLKNTFGETVELVEGDSTQPESIFASQAKGSIDGLFIATVVDARGRLDEEKQAIPLINTAARTASLIFWTNPTKIKHFYQKYNIEIHLRDKAANEGGFTWTILRTTSFLDNMNPGSYCAMYSAMRAAHLAPDTKTQFISTRDIGLFAAKALADPQRWAGRAVGLAGDNFTLAETRAAVLRVTGKRLPESPTFLARILLRMLPEVRAMYGFFQNEGFGVDIEAVKAVEPSVQDFETWLKESSRWK
ncbi:NAD(P)-binding protein [Thozetella sp. PMI_491]|nr:NAD(P)-binding protein [Thozetella sp. PMI_491]